jgi:hypothetical protein
MSYFDEDEEAVKEYCKKRGLYLTIGCTNPNFPHFLYQVGPTAEDRQSFGSLRAIQRVWGTIQGEEQ